MAPYLGVFQAAADAEFQRGFAQRPGMDGGPAQKQLPPMAVEAAEEIARLHDDVPLVDETATIIAKHTAPLADMLRQLAERVGPIVDLLRESRREHATSCRAYSNYQPPYKDCTCGADDWNKRVDEVLGEE